VDERRTTCISSTPWTEGIEMTPSAGTLAGDRRVGAYTKYRLYPPGTIGTKNPGMMNSFDIPVTWMSVGSSNGTRTFRQ
jgi:hypothetical protein